MKKHLLWGLLIALFALFVLLAASSLAFAMPEAAAPRTPRPAGTVVPPATPTAPPEVETDAEEEDLSAAAVTPVTPGAMTSSVLLSNSSASTAQAVLHIYNASATEVFSVTASIRAKGAAVLAMPAGLPAGFLGSGLVTSDQPVQALVLNSNNAKTARDLYESTSAPSTQLIFPVYRHLGRAAQKSIISVQNTDVMTTASVNFHMYEADGTEAAGSPIVQTIPPLASYHFDSLALFGTAIFTRTVSVDSTVKLAGAEQVLFVKDTASLRGLAGSDQGTEFYLNPIERSSVNWSEIYVHNNGSAPANVTTKFYTTAGLLKSSVSQTIAPHGFYLFNTQTLTALGTAFVGYAKVTQPGSEPLAAAWLESNSSGIKFYGYTGVPSTQYALNWACGDVRRYTAAPTQYTTLKIGNVGAAAATITVKLFNPTTGAQKATKKYSLAAGKILSVPISGSSFAGVGTKYDGLAWVQATGAQIVVSASTTYGTGGIVSYTCNNLP